jgi:hypothetical protein
MSHEGALLLTIAALPFVGALLPGLMIRAGRNVCAITTAVPTLAALTMLLILAPAVLRGEVVQAKSNGCRSSVCPPSFFLDGLGLLFAGMILGVGSLDHRFMPGSTCLARIRWGSSTRICCCSRGRCWASSFRITSCFC